MGLTEAFMPVDGGEGQSVRGARAEEGDSPIGLTEAFAPVGVRYQPSGDDGEEPEGAEAADADDSAADPFGHNGIEPERPRGRHARHATTPVDLDDDDEDDDWEDTGDFPAVTLGTLSATEVTELPADPEKMTRAQKKAAKRQARDAMPTYMKKSRRTRRILTVIVILLIVLAAAGVYLVSQLVSTVGDNAAQQAQTTQDSVDVNAIDSTNTTDASSSEKTTTVPNLTGLLGKTQEDAIAQVGRGAAVSMDREVSEAGSAIVREVRLSLNDEPADARIGVPTVYLGLNASGVIVQAGYSVSTSSLGYGALSFADAVTGEHVVERTLQEAGAPVEDGAAVLPEDESAFTSYGPDGVTRTREYCSFGGSVDIDGLDCVWSAILSYDYNTANATGNLADTVRTVYIYIDSPDAIAPEPEPETEEAEAEAE